MFTNEGRVNAKCIDALLVTPQEYRKSTCDSDCEVWLHLEVEFADGSKEQDYWKGFVSFERYSHLDRHSGETEAKVTFDNLHSAGFEGFDLSTIKEQMVDKIIPVNCKLGKEKDGKRFMNIYIDSYAPATLDNAEAKRRAAAICAAMMNGGNTEGQDAPPAPAAAKPPVKAFVKGGASPFAPRK